MINIDNIKTAPQSIKYLNDVVLGRDPEAGALSRVYESSIPIQDRIDDLETNRVNEATVEALQAKVDSLEALTTTFANLAYPVPNLVVNGDFSDGLSPWTGYYNASLSIVDNALKVIKSTASNISTFRQSKVLDVTTADLFYISLDIKTSYSFVYFRISAYHSGGESFLQSPNYNVIPANFNTFSHIGNFSSDFTTTSLGIGIYVDSAINTSYLVDNIKVYNVSQMKLKGVKNDEGVPFTLLTNAQIKTQIDLWVQTRFPLDVLLMMRS